MYLHLNSDLYLDLSSKLYAELNREKFEKSFQQLFLKSFALSVSSMFVSKNPQLWVSSCLEWPRHRLRGRHRRGRKGNRGYGIGTMEVRTYSLGRWDVYYNTH